MPSSAAASLLIVDDDPGVADALLDVLTDEGYRVAVARDGYEALAYVRAARPPPCLILLDWMMPGCDGGTFRAIQQAEPEIADIPVAILSADARIGENPETAGAVACLVKPVDLEVLLDLVAAHCAGR